MDLFLLGISFLEPERGSLRAVARTCLFPFRKPPFQEPEDRLSPGPICPPRVCSLDSPPPVPQLLLFLMDPFNEEANYFSPETWSSCLGCYRREVEVTAPVGRRGEAAASLALAGGFSPPGTLTMQNVHQIQPVPYDL